MLKGHLEHFALADVFRLMSWAKKTGKLEVVRSAGRGKIFFRDGDVYYAESSLSREPLGQKLIRAGSLSESQLMKALDQNAQSGERVGQILVSNGWVTEEQLQEALKQQIEDAVFDLLRWELGEFDYQPFVEADIEVQISVSVENLIIEASRRLDELEVIQRKIPSEESVLRMASRPPEGAAEINITPEEWRMLVLVDGQRDVHQIAQLVGIDDFGALRGLYGLVSAGLVEVVGGEHESVPGMEESVAAFTPGAHQAPPTPEQMASEPRFTPPATVAEPIQPAPEPVQVQPPAEKVSVQEDVVPAPAPQPVIMERTAQSLVESQPAATQPAETSESETAFQSDPDTGAWDSNTMSSVFHVEEEELPAPAAGVPTETSPAEAFPVEAQPVETFDAPQPGELETAQPDPFLNDLLADQPVGGESPAPPAPSAHQPQVDRSTVVKELAGLFSDDERPQRPAGASPDGEAPADQRKRLEDDDQLNRGLITRLIDGVKGL